MRFKPSKLKIFSKDGESVADDSSGDVKTFFDTLNLKGGGGGSVVDDKEPEDDEGDDEGDDEIDPELDPAAKSPELTAMQEQLRQAQEQNAKLMQMLQGKQEEDGEEETLSNPFETESFDNLAETMDWDDSERKAMKAFMQSALDYQSQATLSTAKESINDIVNSSMSQVEKEKAVRKQFFAENPKLEPVKDYVSTVASGVLKEYQALGKSLDPAQILKEAASRAYKTLGIDPKGKKGKTDTESESDPNPAFPSMKVSSKNRNQTVNKTRTQKMITSMIDL